MRSDRQRGPIAVLCPCAKPCVLFLSWDLTGQAVGTPSSCDQGSLRAGDAHLVLITVSCCPWPWRVSPLLSDGSFRDGSCHPFGSWRYQEWSACHHGSPVCPHCGCLLGCPMAQLPAPAACRCDTWHPGPRGSSKVSAWGAKDAWCWVLHSQLSWGRMPLALDVGEQGFPLDQRRCKGRAGVNSNLG